MKTLILLYFSKESSSFVFLGGNYLLDSNYDLSFFGTSSHYNSLIISLTGFVGSLSTYTNLRVKQIWGMDIYTEFVAPPSTCSPFWAYTLTSQQLCCLKLCTLFLWS